MFERILVPVDFSDHSRSAFGHGALFARTFGGEIELCHVVEEVVHTHPPFWLDEGDLAHQLEQQAQKSAELSLERLLPTLPVQAGTKVRTRVLHGTVPGALVERAEQWPAQLIVVSTHGRSGLSRWLMGSVSERLLRTSPCPVLVARGGSDQALPKLTGVLVAVDLSELSRRALQLAGALATAFGASLEVLYVWAAPYYDEHAAQRHPGGAQPASGLDLFERIRQHARDELDEFVRASALPAGLSLTQTILSGTPSAKITERVRDAHVDLLVLATHGHGGFRRMMLGSVAEASVRYAGCATLIVP